jgi:hypothetical protein
MYYPANTENRYTPAERRIFDSMVAAIRGAENAPAISHILNQFYTTLSNANPHDNI